MNKIVLGIDASNVTNGGGLTHCLELLKSYNKDNHVISKIVIWSSQKTLDQIPNKENIVKRTHYFLQKSFYIRMIWNLLLFKGSLKKEKCDILLVLGGYFFFSFKPSIVVCQNMLSFEKHERKNFGFSIQRLKLSILGYIQKISFLKSNGIIFLSKYASHTVIQDLKLINKPTCIIPHGIDKRFYIKRKKLIKNFNVNSKESFKIIYVSKVDMYKHHWHVAEAVSKIRKKGFNISLEIIGGSYKPALKKLKKKLINIKDSETFIKYVGEVPYDQLHNYYIDKDLIIFASSCENLPIILLEGMATALPIISSNLGPMPEVLKDNAYYFNPYDVESIEEALYKILICEADRIKFATNLVIDSENYSWEKTSKNTFEFINLILNKNK